MEIQYEHQHRSKRDNLLYTVKYGLKGGYYFIEVINNKNVIKFVIESDSWMFEFENIMRAWGTNERNITELMETVINNK